MQSDSDSKHQVSWEDLDKYLAGEAGKEESVRIAAWLSQLPGSEAIFRHQGKPLESNTDLRAARWDVLAERLDSAAPAPNRPSYQQPFTARRYINIGVAASLALILTTAAWFGGQSKSRHDISQFSSVFQTDYARQASVTLPDGSEVVLDVGSRIDVKSDFMSSHRMVELTGQALFKVRQNSALPFIVSSVNGDVQVLGTEFAVSAYSEDSAVSVNVISGKVSVGNIVLTEGQQVSWSDSMKRAFPVSEATNASMTSFSTGTLAFRNQSLGSVSETLSRWYGKEIVITSDRLRDMRITGSFRLGYVPDFTEALAYTLGARVEVNDTSIIVNEQL